MAAITSSSKHDDDLLVDQFGSGLSLTDEKSRFQKGDRVKKVKNTNKDQLGVVCSEPKKTGGVWKIRVVLDSEEVGIERKPEFLQTEDNYEPVDIQWNTGDDDVEPSPKEQPEEHHDTIEEVKQGKRVETYHDTTIDDRTNYALEVFKKVLDRTTVATVNDVQMNDMETMVGHIEDCITALRIVRQLKSGNALSFDMSSAIDEDPHKARFEDLYRALISKLFLPKGNDMKIVVEEVGDKTPTKAEVPSTPCGICGIVEEEAPKATASGTKGRPRKSYSTEEIKTTPQKAKQRTSLSSSTALTAPIDEYLDYYLTHNNSIDGRPDPRIIPDMIEPEYKYKSGPDKALPRVPWIEEQKLEPAIDPLLRQIPQWDHDKKKVWLWSGPKEKKEYTRMEWEEQLATWQFDYPNVTRPNGSNPFEPVSHRTKMTSDKKIIEATFNALPAFGSSEWGEYRANWSSQTKTLLAKFRPDMWGNMICLPDKIDPAGAVNESLCFFDVDHLFPFSRGGQSVFKKGSDNNFGAVQCVANRTIKNDNLIPLLNPVEMNCGITSEQLVAMVLYVENLEGGKGEGEIASDERTIKSRKDKNKLRDRILTWLTGSPIKGQSFRCFSTDVKRSTDGKVLLDYFRHRQRHEDDALLGQPDATHVSDTSDGPSLKIYVTKCMIEVGGATFYVKARLKEDNYWWDAKEQRWGKGFSSKAEKEQLLRGLQALACQNGFVYKVMK